MAVSRLPGSWIGGSSTPPVAAPGTRRWSETSERWRQLLDAMATAPSLAALAAAHDDDVAILVEAQKLRQAQVEARGYARGDRQRRTRFPTLDLRQHRRAD